VPALEQPPPTSFQSLATQTAPSQAPLWQAAWVAAGQRPLPSHEEDEVVTPPAHEEARQVVSTPG
jgi:hypothetical protein